MKAVITAMALMLALLCCENAASQSDRVTDRLTDRPFEATPLQVLRVALDLSPDQLSEIRALLHDRTELIGPLSRQINTLQAHLEEIFAMDAQDPQAIGEIVLELQALQAERGRILASFSEDFHLLLTAEQREHLAWINRVALANRAVEALNQLQLRR